MAVYWVDLLVDLLADGLVESLGLRPVDRMVCVSVKKLVGTKDAWREKSLGTL